jgi:hypothetical protein
VGIYDLVSCIYKVILLFGLFIIRIVVQNE